MELIGPGIQYSGKSEGGFYEVEVYESGEMIFYNDLVLFRTCDNETYVSNKGDEYRITQDLLINDN